MPITRVAQLEQALAYAREMNADLQRRHEAAERAWRDKFARLQERLDFLQSCVTTRVVQRSKQGTH